MKDAILSTTTTTITESSIPHHDRNMAAIFIEIVFALTGNYLFAHFFAKVD
jgi:hypothetical protein